MSTGIKTLAANPLTFSRQECAALLGCSVSTLDRMLQSGTLHGVRIGKRRLVIPRTEIDRLLAIASNQGDSK